MDQKKFDPLFVVNRIIVSKTVQFRKREEKVMSQCGVYELFVYMCVYTIYTHTHTYRIEKKFPMDC